MHAHSTHAAPSERLRIAYTVKPVSGWGELVPLMRHCERLGVRHVLQRALPGGRTSPNQIPAGEIILVFFAAVLTGATRFAHVERLRTDSAVRAILGVARRPSAGALLPPGCRLCPWGPCWIWTPRSSNVTATRKRP